MDKSELLSRIKKASEKSADGKFNITISYSDVDSAIQCSNGAKELEQDGAIRIDENNTSGNTSALCHIAGWYLRL